MKAWVRLSFVFFIRRIKTVNGRHLSAKGPLLLAVNHPNSFFDAIVTGGWMKEPVYYMTRGDVFRKPWVRKILSQLKMIPIFRIRDGKDKLSENEETFRRSVEVLRNNEILLIFVEGTCEHQKELLLPLKKGAPRIIQECWQEGIPVKVLPLWLEYSSFDRFGKTVQMRFGEAFGSEVATDINNASCINEINAATTEGLLSLSKEHSLVPYQPGIASRIILLVPAMLGAVLHAPLYLPVQRAVSGFTKGTVFYDSVMFAFLLLGYPLYLLIIFLVLLVATHQWWALLVFAVFPLTAKAYLHWKK
jgi:1-acyl-sn-glycerol-3-phosphate acyltransferase